MSNDPLATSNATDPAVSTATDTATQIDQNVEGDITVDFGNDGVDAVVGGDAQVALNPDGSVTIDFRDMARDIDPGAEAPSALDTLPPVTPEPETSVTPEPEPTAVQPIPDHIQAIINQDTANAETQASATDAVMTVSEAVERMQELRADGGPVTARDIADMIKAATIDRDSAAAGTELDGLKAYVEDYLMTQPGGLTDAAVQAWDAFESAALSERRENVGQSGGMDGADWEAAMEAMEQIALSEGAEARFNPETTPAGVVDVEQVRSAINGLDDIEITVGDETFTISLEVPTDLDGEYQLNADGSHEVVVDIEGLDGPITDEQLAAIQAILQKKLLEEGGLGDTFSAVEVVAPEEGVDADAIVRLIEATEVERAQGLDPALQAALDSQIDDVNGLLGQMLAAYDGLDVDTSSGATMLAAHLGDGSIADIGFNADGNIEIALTEPNNAASELSAYGTTNESGALITIDVPENFELQFDVNGESQTASTADIKTAIAAALARAQQTTLMAGEPTQDPSSAYG